VNRHPVDDYSLLREKGSVAYLITLLVTRW